MRYTVVLLRPDYWTNNYGQDSATVHANGDTVSEAVLDAREKLAEWDNLFEVAPAAKLEDYFVVVVFHGHHDDVNS